MVLVCYERCAIRLSCFLLCPINLGMDRICFFDGHHHWTEYDGLSAGVDAFERFIRAWGTLAYHEILLVISLLLILKLCWGAENTFGMWTFIVLYAARVFAKLNLFFGVPRINLEFVPQALDHLKSHFKIAALNWFFPLVTL